MICYVLAMGKQHLGPHVVVGYGIKIFWPGLFFTSPDHLAYMATLDAPLFGAKLEAWRQKMFHIFHFLQCEMVLGIVNPL